MDVRSQLAMVFHLDKCLGCHTCSVACKNIWTNRPGAEYMWWNNVESKPGTGYPTRWEDQDQYHGGWERRGHALGLKSASRLQTLAGMFHHPHMPSLDDYYDADVQVRIVAVPDGWVAPVPTPFNKKTMNALADMGEKMGADPASWRTSIP